VIGFLNPHVVSRAVLPELLNVLESSLRRLDEPVTKAVLTHFSLGSLRGSEPFCVAMSGSCREDDPFIMLENYPKHSQIWGLIMACPKCKDFKNVYTKVKGSSFRWKCNACQIRSLVLEEKPSWIRILDRAQDTPRQDYRVLIPYKGYQELLTNFENGLWYEFKSSQMKGKRPGENRSANDLSAAKRRKTGGVNVVSGSML
jgi:hypothetical protein